MFISEHPDQKEISRVFSPTLKDPASSSFHYLYLGEKLISADPKLEKVTFINLGKGGAGTHYWLNEDTYYRLFINAVKKYNPNAILWSCGTNDALHGAKENEGYELLEKLIHDVKKINPAITWFISLEGLPNDLNAPVRKAQKKNNRG